MTVVNPKSISGINSITMASGSDNLLTIHSNNTTERVRVDSSGNLTATGNLSIEGNTTLGNASSDTVTVTGHVNSDIVPSGSTRDLGGSGTEWRNLYTANGVIASDTISSHASDSNTKIRFPAEDTVTVETGGGERVRIFANGDIGVNATTINRASTSRNTIQFDYSGNDGSEGLEIRLSNSALNGNAATDNAAITYIGQNLGITNRENGNITFRNNGSERLQITSTGLIYVNGDGTGGRIDATAGDSSIKISDGNGRSSIKVSDPGSGNSYEWELTSAGNFKVPNGKGIDFSAYATSGNPSSNLLDDYEEGTFSPAFKAENNSSNATTNVNEVGYTKVGNLVYFRFFITLTSHASGSTGGSAYINGLPFTSSNGHSAVHIGYFATWAQNQTFVTATMQPSSNEILLRHYTSAAASTSNMDYDNNLQPNSKVIISGCYQTA